MDDNGAALQAYKYRLYWEGGLFFFGEWNRIQGLQYHSQGAKDRFLRGALDLDMELLA
jgi:hypothetical protein